MVALERAGIPVDRYVAYEIDKYAIKVSQKNYPQIEHCGDVTTVDFTKHKGFDLLIGGSPCFTKGHLVLTKNGYKDISEIVVGDLVLTHTGSYKPVIRTNTRSAEIYSLKIQGYPEFKTTENHPFYCIKRAKAPEKERIKNHSNRVFTHTPEWIPVKDLNKDCFCGQHILKAKESKNEFQLNEELCWLLGRYVADGHLRKTKRKNRKNSYKYQVVISVGNSKVEEFKENVTHIHFSCFPHTQSTYRCVFSSQKLLEFIENQNFGKGANNKRIPEFIYSLPISLQESFLNGYMSGDGCLNKNDYSYHCSTVSKELAFGLQRLITGLYSTNVGVSVSQPRVEIHKIGDRIIKSNYPLYSIGFKKGLRKQSVAHMQNNIMWTQVKSIINTHDVDTVYNIEVADDNSYTVNNCIVHNCTFWSIAKNNREITPDGIGGQLFMHYVRALKESGCKYFLYENNYSIHKDIKAFISEQLGVEPIMINSALVSAQQRKRCYWTNIPNVVQPKDKGILLKDIIESGIVWQDKSYAYTTRCQGATFEDTLKRHRHTMIAEPIHIGEYGKGVQSQRIYSVMGKSVCLFANGGSAGAKTGLYKIDLPDGDYIFRKLTPVEAERAQTLPDNYTEGISNTQRYKCIGNGWTVDVIAHILSFLLQKRGE